MHPADLRDDPDVTNTGITNYNVVGKNKTTQFHTSRFNLRRPPASR